MLETTTVASRPDRSNIAQAGVLNIAHRGASGRAPENTLAAVTAALMDGADLVEFDVRRTRDGALVLMHDATLTRTTDARRLFPSRAPWRVEDFSLHELRRLQAGDLPGEGIPTLAECLDLIRPTGVGALVELKADAAGDLPVLELAEQLREAPRERVTTQSFHVAGLEILRDLLPSARLAVLGSWRRRDLRALSHWADQVHVHHRRVDRRLVGEAHGWGMRCMVWTVNRPHRMRQLVGLGVDGVITDHPALFRHVVKGR